MTYLDRGPFTEQGVAVVPFLSPSTGMWASERCISAVWAIAVRGPEGVAARLRVVASAVVARR